MIPLGGAPGTGPAAALRMTIDGHDCTVLAHRTAAGRPELAAFPTEDEEAGLWWAETGEPCLGAPGVALTRAAGWSWRRSAWTARCA